MTFSVCEDWLPNAVVEYVDAETGAVLHVDEFFNIQKPPFIPIPTTA